MNKATQLQCSSTNSRLWITLTLIAIAVLAIVATPPAQAQTYMFNRADYPTGQGPQTLAVGDSNGKLSPSCKK